MKRNLKMVFLSAGLALGFPLVSLGQSSAASVADLQSVLNQVYDQMLPLCSGLIGIGRALAGFGALTYIAYRVWGHLARAEPIDFYPLLRPFAIGLAIGFFPQVIGMINGILEPVTEATSSMVQNSNSAISLLLHQRQQALQQFGNSAGPGTLSGGGLPSGWLLPDPGGQGPGSLSGWGQGLGTDIRLAMEQASLNLKNSIWEGISQVLQLIFEAASLCIDTIRTFNLLVLAILGPLVFGLSVFDGLRHTITVWLARYINCYLWLPVANIFGSLIGTVEQHMLQTDILQIHQQGQTFFNSTDTAYLVFLIIGIAGYFTVPGIANYIIHPGGGMPLLQQVNRWFHGPVFPAGSAAGGMEAAALGPAAERMSSGLQDSRADASWFSSSAADSFRQSRIRGD